MADYLMHFNPRHDPKTGRFDFSLEGEKATNYGGRKRSEYKKDLVNRYKSEGHSNFKSKRLADFAIKATKNEVQQYNNNLRANKHYQKKALKSYEKDNEKAYNKSVKHIIDSYKYAKIHEKLLAKDVELGKIFYKSIDQELAEALLFGGAIGGAVKGAVDASNQKGYWKLLAEAKKDVEREMTSDYITKHPKEARDAYAADMRLQEYLEKNRK